jgi:phosphoglycerate dehydrogenase-like enzyme
MALILALTRRIPEACDNQAKRFWRGIRIGGRLAHLAKAFDLRVIGVRRDLAAGSNNADVLDILCENLDRLWRGEATLRNQVV